MASASGRARLDLKRGDFVVSVGSGDYGKPRPALVVQSDLFNKSHPSVVICPITSELVDAPGVSYPRARHGRYRYKVASHIMIDKIGVAREDRIGKRIGRASPALMKHVNAALRLLLDLPN